MLLPESFFDDEDSDDETGGVAPGLDAEPWLLASPGGAFPSWCEAGSHFVGTAKLVSAADRFCVFGVAEDIGALFELACTGAGGRNAEATGCVSGSAM